MALTDLIKSELRFLLFGGKGGVGKTTMSAASAVQIALGNPKEKILIFTTDPAPSLADSFGQTLSNEPMRVSGVANLWALEIDAGQELVKFKKKYGEDILDILQQGTYLSDQESEEMFSLDIPGLDEVMGLKRITDFMESSDYDHYILDTAPTGHTLRLLTLPALLDNWIKFLAQLRWKYHYMVDRFSRGQEKRIESADKFLIEMKKTVQRVQNILTDPQRTSFVVVTIAEAMGVAETRDLISDLKKYKIPSRHIIINNLIPHDSSPFMKKRRKLQKKYVDEIRKSFPRFELTKVELQATEVRGMEQLTVLGKDLFNIV